MKKNSARNKDEERPIAKEPEKLAAEQKPPNPSGGRPTDGKTFQSY